MDFIDRSKDIVAKMIKVVGLPEKGDEIERQVLGAFIFGVINGLALETKIDPIKVQGVMIEVLVNSLDYPENKAAEFCQLLIDSTDENHHPTMNTIIHRGITAYYDFINGDSIKVKNNLNEVIDAVKNEVNMLK